MGGTIYNGPGGDTRICFVGYGTVAEWEAWGDSSPRSKNGSTRSGHEPVTLDSTLSPVHTNTVSSHSYKMVPTGSNPIVIVTGANGSVTVQ